MLGQTTVSREQYIGWRTRWRKSYNDLVITIRALKAIVRSHRNDWKTIARAQQDLDMARCCAHSMMLARTQVDQFKPEVAETTTLQAVAAG